MTRVWLWKILCVCGLGSCCYNNERKENKKKYLREPYIIRTISRNYCQDNTNLNNNKQKKGNSLLKQQKKSGIEGKCLKFFLLKIHKQIVCRTLKLWLQYYGYFTCFSLCSLCKPLLTSRAKKKEETLSTKTLTQSLSNIGVYVCMCFVL